jgi:3-methyladenine DNA glycosylase AlkC
MPVLTRRWSCEFAIRPFLDAEPDLTLDHLRRWVADDDELVRRLVSEGTRPRLPWAPRVQLLLDDPAIGIDLLTELRHDPSETVRRSVANHLNDVARAHPDLVVDTLSGWAADPEVDPRLVRHALRTLVKDGHPGALEILGVTTDPSVEVDAFVVTPDEIRLGDHVELTAHLTSTAGAGQRLVVDFVIHHIGADGTSRPKVFKWTTVDLPAGESVELRKRRRIQTASTRRYHAGYHRVGLQVAGAEAASGGFDLLESST